MQDLGAEIKSLEGNSSKRASTQIKMEQMKVLESNLASLNILYESKLESVEKWRIQMKAKHKVADEEAKGDIHSYMLGSESEYVANLIKKICSKLHSEEEKKEIEKALLTYAQKVREREIGIQKALAKAENIKNHLQELEIVKQENESKLIVLEQETPRLKSEYLAILQNEKAYIKQKETGKISFEHGISKQGDEEYKEFLKKNDDIFKGVKKAYGSKAAEKMKVEHRKEIGVLTNVKQIERRQMIKSVHEELIRINAILNNTEVFSTLKEKIVKVMTYTDPFSIKKSSLKLKGKLK